MSVEDTLLVFADAGGVPGRWRLLSGGAVVGRGDVVDELPAAKPWVRIVLAVPGTEVTLHWLELSDGLTAVQAAAAGRMQLAEDAAEPLAGMHVAGGRTENGMTCIAMVPAARMAAWIASAREIGLEPDLMIPEPLLLMAPGEGLVRYDGGIVPDYRGTARAFSAEDALAELVIGEEPVREIDDGVREAGLAQVLTVPPINLRQGVFVRRREWVIDWARMRRLALLMATLLLVSLAIQVVVILRTTFAADRYEEEATELRRALGSRPGAAQVAVSYAPVASAVFDAIRETPTAELTQFAYQPGGAMSASILADSQPTLDALRARIEQRGMQVQGGLPISQNGRVSAQLTIRRR